MSIINNGMFLQLKERAYHIIWLSETSSTNSYADNLIKTEGDCEDTVIVADEQTLGRGQKGTFWESLPGENLLLSIILQPEFLLPEKQFYLNKFLSLAVYDFISLGLKGITKLPVKIKWPNDIYIGNKKVAGILPENTIMGDKLSWCVGGIGINVNQEVFSNDVRNPISLKLLTAIDYDLEILLFELMEYVEDRYSMLVKERFQVLDHDYLNGLFWFGEFKKYKVGNEVLTLKITGVTVYGKLCLQSKEGDVYEFDMKEIEFLI